MTYISCSTCLLHLKQFRNTETAAEQHSQILQFTEKEGGGGEAERETPKHVRRQFRSIVVDTIPSAFDLVQFSVKPL